MNGPNTEGKGVSRRGFLGMCGSVGVAACGLGGLAGCQVAGGAGPWTFGSRYRFKPIVNWPQLPDDVAFGRILGVATDSRGRVYVTAGNLKKNDETAVHVIAPDGKYLGSWGADILGRGHGVRIINERVWVTDVFERHQIYEFTLDGRLLRSFGTRNEAGLGENQFNRPTDIAFTPNGDIYVSDGYGNSRIVCMAADGSFRWTWGTRGTKPGQFNVPHNIVIDAKGRVYVADRRNRRIQVFTAKGQFLAEWLHAVKPYGLALAPDQTLFVADAEGNRVLVLSLDGRLLTAFGETGTEPGQFQTAHSIHVDQNWNLYVAEVDGKRVQKFVPVV